MPNVYNKIRNYIASGNIKKALDSLNNSGYFIKEDQNSIILISSRYNSNERKHTKGLLTNEQHNVNTANIVHDLLNLVDSIESKSKINYSKEKNYHPKVKSIIDETNEFIQETIKKILETDNTISDTIEELNILKNNITYEKQSDKKIEYQRKIDELKTKLNYYIEQYEQFKEKYTILQKSIENTINLKEVFIIKETELENKSTELRKIKNELEKAKRENNSIKKELQESKKNILDKVIILNKVKANERELTELITSQKKYNREKTDKIVQLINENKKSSLNLKNTKKDLEYMKSNEKELYKLYLEQQESSKSQTKMINKLLQINDDYFQKAQEFELLKLKLKDKISQLE